MDSSSKMLTSTSTSPSTTASKATTMTNLKLEEETSDHSRYLTICSNHILAIGGENGNISAIPLPNNCDNNDNDTTLNTNKAKARIIQRYDEPVKALAFSSDGRRVAVGYDDGCVDIYVYNEEDMDANRNVNGDGDGESTFVHPFISKKNASKDGNDDNDENDDNANDGFGDDDIFTQSSQFGEDGENGNTPTFRLKHRFEASIRHLQFQPQPKTQSKSQSQSSQSQSKQKYHLAIAAESSPGFMIVDVTSENSFQKYLDEDANTAYHQGGVRSLSYSPDGSRISTLGMDGKMCIWSTKGDDPTLDWELVCEDEFKVVDKADMGEFAEIGDQSLYPVWSHCGKILGIPGSCDVKFRMNDDSGSAGDDKEDWMKKNRMILNLSCKDKKNDDLSIVGLAFDPTNGDDDGGYIVTSTREGKICLWQIDHDRKEDEPEGTLVKEIVSNESMCTHIIWHKDGRTNTESLYMALQNGSMMTITGRDNFIPKKAKKINLENAMDCDLQIGGESNVSIPSMTKKNQSLQKGRLSKKPLHNDDGHNDDDDAVFDEQENTQTSKNQFVDDEAEDNMNNDDESQFDDVLTSQKDPVLDNIATDSAIAPQQDLQKDMDMDINEDGSSSYGADDFGNNEDDYGEEHHIPGTSIATVQPQPAFAPSATPLASRTILCWNHIGVITSREGDDLVKTIDISFTDAMANRPVSFRDNIQFIVGSLGEEGAIFSTDVVDNNDDDLDDNIRETLDGLNGMSDATKDVVKRSERKGKGDRATGSCVYFHRFQTFGPIKNKDWVVTLPEGEKVLGCATGEGWNAVVTSRRFLRTFTSGGVQGPIVWLKGEPVTMVGRGRFLAVFYHECNPLVDGTQKLGYALYDGATMRQISSGSVSGISVASSLTWAGFSNDLALSIMDDDGMVSLLMATKPDETGDDSSFSWVPMLDTIGLRKSREDSFWPVSIQNGKLICVPLKGVSYPNPTRRPLTTALQLRIPLARDGKDKTFGLEEVAVRSNLAVGHKNFLNDFMSNYGSADTQAMEMEYDEICAQVDKITLKLFFKMIEVSKLEAALDLVNRLHLEQSFEIAMTAADRSNYRKLSDRIFTMREQRFNSNLDDDFSDDDDQGSYDGSITTFSRESNIVDTRRVKVSPEAPLLKQKMKHQDESSPKPKSRKRINPFATNTKKSPGKKPLMKSAKKEPTLSRMSTFSAESRRISKASKEII